MLLNNQCEFDLACTGTPVPTVKAVPETSPVGKMLEIFAHARFREMPALNNHFQEITSSLIMIFDFHDILRPD